MSRASTWVRGVWNAHLKQDSLIESEVEQRFILLSFGWNCAEYVRGHMQSIEQQRYDNYIHVVVDDGSTDRSYSEIVSHKHAKVIAHRNDTRVGWLRNSILYVDQYIQGDEDILLQVDLDDRLAHPKVLSHLNGLFAQEDLWVVHGGRGWPRSILRDRSFRANEKWGRFSPPRAFRAFLWKAIDKEDFKGPDGQYALSAQDRALYYPVLEMTPRNKLRSAETELYVYNQEHGIHRSEDESRIRQQADNARWFRSKRPYPILKRDSLACFHTRDIKKVALLTAKPNKDSTQSVREKRPPHGIGFLYSILRNEKDLQV
jgi:glycosyltransferase involved in cell wall biosynthesis